MRLQPNFRMPNDRGDDDSVTKNVFVATILHVLERSICAQTIGF